MIGRTLSQTTRVRKALYHAAVLAYAKTFKGQADFVDALFKALEDLGGVYIKFIQLIALRTEVFNEENRMRLLTFYDEVPPEPLDIDSFLLVELGDKAKQLLHVDQLPFAGGSFAQVYKAQLRNGTDVVVKVKRADLRMKLRIDFMLLRLILFGIDIFYDQRLVNLKKAAAEFKKLTFKELDYVSEAKNADLLFNYYLNHATVQIPRTYVDLCTSNCIVQEFVEGLPLTEVLRMKNKDPDYRLRIIEDYHTDIRHILRKLGYEITLQGFNLGQVYGDPHPGNIFILRNNKFALIDFGIFNAVPPNKKTQYRLMELVTQTSGDMDTYELGKHILRFGAEPLYKSIELIDRKLSNHDRGIMDVVADNYMSLLDTKKTLLKQILKGEYSRFRKLFFEVVDTGEKFNVQIPEVWVNMLRSGFIFSSYTAYLDPDYRFMHEVYAEILEELDYNSLLDGETVAEPTLEEAIDNVLDWITGVAEKDISLYIQMRNILKNSNYL